MQIACLIALGVVLCLWYIHMSETKNEKHWFRDTDKPIDIKVQVLCRGAELLNEEFVEVLEKTDEEPLIGKPMLRKVIMDSRSFYCIIERESKYCIKVFYIEIPKTIA